MERKRTFSIVIAILIVIGISCIAAVTYSHRKAPAKPTNYQSLYKATQKQVQTLQTSNDTLNAQVTELTTEKAALCTQLTTAKQTNALCTE